MASFLGHSQSCRDVTPAGACVRLVLRIPSKTLHSHSKWLPDRLQCSLRHQNGPTIIHRGKLRKNADSRRDAERNDVTANKVAIKGPTRVLNPTALSSAYCTSPHGNSTRTIYKTVDAAEAGFAGIRSQQCKLGYRTRHPIPKCQELTVAGGESRLAQNRKTFETRKR